MDYSRFRLQAVVDWIELDVSTLKRRVGWRIWAAGGGVFSHVAGLDPDTGNDIGLTGSQGANTPTTRFAVRIQSPDRFLAITSALSTIADLNQSVAITVRGIEVAFDAYRLDGTTDAHLVEMTAFMLRAINRPEGSKEAPRFYGWQGTPELRYGEQQVLPAILEGKTAMFGNEGDSYIVRGYLKNYDTQRDENGNNRRITIANNLEHRARIEVRLQAGCCPLRTLDDLKDFKFESMARFFKFHVPAEDLTTIETLVASKTGSLGGVIDLTSKTIAIHRHQGRARKTRGGTQASPLNEDARDQLRNLTLRWRSRNGRSRRRIDENSGSKGASSLATNYLNEQVPKPAESTGQIGAFEVPATMPGTPKNIPINKAVLNTSFPELAHPGTQRPELLSSPCTSLPNLNNTDYPALPDLTGDPAEL